MSALPPHLDKYELLERLGQGGSAEVWKARDTQLERFVAIKLLHPDLREDPNFTVRFEHEARLIASLHHPNIVQIHDFQMARLTPTTPDQMSMLAYMVMDYVEGSTLAHYIQQTSLQGAIPSPLEIVNLFTSISLAVDYAHSKGMLHRDIKPANILLDQRLSERNPMGEPILTDFGVAKMLSASTNTRTQVQVGTPFYLSPEQASGYPGDERSDLYALGVILYEMVTGVLPFRGETPLEVIAQQLNAEPLSPALINDQLPPALVHVIMRSLSKHPSERFSSASALTTAIAEALNLPIPERLGASAYPPALRNMSTEASYSAGVPAIGSAAQGEPSKNVALLTPASSAAIQHVSARIPVTDPAARPQLSAPVVVRKRPRFLRSLLLLALLLVILAGSGLFAFIYWPQPVASQALKGHAFFSSSGQIDLGSAQGVADKLQIDLQQVPPPQAGYSYYVWLLGDIQPLFREDLVGVRPFNPPLLLTNNLPVQNGNVHYVFAGDEHHNNLLSTTSRLLITEEVAHRVSGAPSNDRTRWRYYAALPQKIIPLDKSNFSALIHIRHLLYNETDTRVLGLAGGLDLWLLRNSEKVLEWSVSARDDWHGPTTTSTDLMNKQFIRILDQLDGVNNFHIDMPPTTPVLADALGARVALLTVDPLNQGGTHSFTNPLGYVDHIQVHVSQVVKATDISQETRQHAQDAVDALKNVKIWLTQVHQDAVDLFNLGRDPQQLTQQRARELLDDMVTNATYAYIGKLNPVTNQVQPGVIQAHYAVQQLATFTISSNLPQKL